VTHFVDFHCHLDLYPDFEKLVRECEQARIYTLTVTTTPRAWAHNRSVSAGAKFVRVGLGLHPQLVATHGHELPLWERLLEETTYVGEVGLDAGPRYAKSLGEQERVFRRVLDACTAQGGKILSIHAVRTASKVLDMIEQHLDLRTNTPVLHWFSGSPSEARRAAELGCMFSINDRMLGTVKSTAILNAIPSDRILTETDGPFTESNGNPSRPRDVERCVANLSSELRRSHEEVKALVFSNFTGILERAKRPKH
jgi:TatD DNase family protein